MMGDQNDKQRRCFWSFMDGFWRCGMTPASRENTGREPAGSDRVLGDCRDRAKRVGRRAVVGFQAPNPGLAIPQLRIDDGIRLRREMGCPSGVLS